MEIVPPTLNIAPLPQNTENVLSQEERQQQLPVDKIVRATVAEGGEDRILLDLGQRQVAAETKVPLKSGQKLTLLVLATHPRIELQIVDDTLRERLGRSLYLLDTKWDAATLLRETGNREGALAGNLSRPASDGAALLYNLLNGMTEKPDGGRLSQFLQLLGLGLEARLAKGERAGADNLKAILLELLHNLKGQENTSTEKGAQLLQQLEFFQLCQLRLAQQNQLFFPLLLPFLEQGYLVAEKREYSDESGESGTSYLLSLQLTLKKLGELRVDFLYEQDGIFIRFVSDSPEKMQFIADHKSGLTEALADLKLAGVSFGTGAESTSRSLLAKIMPEGHGGVLDTRI